MSKVPISVCMIAKNEERYLEECLKRIKPYGFEIVVTDTGSTDKTREIAAKYADKVLDFPWVNDFSAARNYCAEHASNPWIIVLDCDEYVESIDMKVLRILMQKMPKAAGNLRLKVLVKNQNDEIQYTTEEVTRCYNRNYYRFDGAIHEQIIPIEWIEKKVSNQVLQAFLLPMDVVHQGYVLSKEGMREKQERNLTILQEALKKEPDDAYLQFQYAQSLYILGYIEKAGMYYEKSLNHHESTDLIYVQACIMGLARCHMRLNRPDIAIAILKKYENQCKTAKYVFMQACLYQDTNQWMKALLYYVKATTMQDVDTLGVNLLNCYENIIELAKKLGNDNMAELFQKQYEACLAEKERVLKTMDGGIKKEKLPVSVCMIVKNEEKYIEECLKRIKPYGFEIVVVDTGSKDQTVTIAKKYADKVIPFSWADDFSEARNFAISHASNPWILILDCDEMVDNIDCEPLQELMKQHEQHVGLLPLKNLQVQNGKETYHIDKVPRFFNKNYYHYIYPIHEQVAPFVMEEGKETVLCTYEIPVSVTHLGYHISNEEMQKKQERNLTILRRSIGKFDCDDYLYFQLGQSLAVLERYEEAADAFEYCFALKPDKRKGYFSQAVCSYARVLLLLQRYDEGITFVKEYAGKITDADFLQVSALLYEAAHQYSFALVYWMQLVHSPQRERIGEEGIYDAYVRAIRLQKNMGGHAVAAMFRKELDAYAASHGKKIRVS